ncbi:hypothetical protein E3Q22_03131 [Wallemia mellicola]|uniref:Uncharacterized protein n=1 Tax=Wallemia mellicola TaxID=1708541 RepID=A0A4T0MJ30_9BASI|nr:hypothetical protein E3Q24_03289 [Wallemia mellicola]TIB77279.1 hypothetical protein E3Q22_03131 [Wallemia mellicola]TIB83097.1 hypothetical protein E3Q21_03082 [Wallemia mellicola]TIB85816.1 hypothetical protein E3Q20_03073 [Wallemia mellicola]TIB97125.1 hypothetical protein E3Q17_03540 [Wallemia mellicola]
MDRIERRSLIDVVDDSIIDLADKYCRAVRKATKPGASHELRAGTTSIPWICTMLAAENLGLLSQFDETVALSRSATRPKDFKMVVETCRKILTIEENKGEEKAMTKIEITPDELVLEYELPRSRIDDCKQLLKLFYAAVEVEKQQIYVDNVKGQYKNEVLSAVFWSMGASLNVHDLPTRNQFISDWQLTRPFHKYAEDVDYYLKEDLDSLRKTGELQRKSSPKRELGLEQSLTTNTKRRRTAAEQADIKRQPTQTTTRNQQNRTRTNDALKDLQSRRTIPQKAKDVNTTPQKPATKSAEAKQTPRRAVARAMRQQRLETVKENNDNDEDQEDDSLFINHWCFTDTFRSSYQDSRWDRFLDVRSSLVDKIA